MTSITAIANYSICFTYYACKFGSNPDAGSMEYVRAEGVCLCSENQVAKVLPDPNVKNAKLGAHMDAEGHDCPQISIYTIEGLLFFGAVNMFEKSIIDAIHMKTRVLYLRMGKVPFMDTTGESNLASLIKYLWKMGGTILITGIQPQPLSVLERTGLYTVIGKEHFFEHSGDAIDYSLTKLDYNRCLGR